MKSSVALNKIDSANGDLPLADELPFSKGLVDGLRVFAARLERQKELYLDVAKWARAQSDLNPIVKVADERRFKFCLETFGPALNIKSAPSNLKRIYEEAFDRVTGALLIANRGATLYCLTPRSFKPYLARHIGIALYLPGLGLEMANVALIGDVYNGKVVCRSESACTPSFLFGSQRCNCAHQWEQLRELAAAYNPAAAPAGIVSDNNAGKAGADFERWVQAQCDYGSGRHLFKKAGPGFVLIHLDTQNGMGSGYSQGEFCPDLFARASMRHRGEYSAEQEFKTSMAGGFTALGLQPDPRSGGENAGYKVAPLILDYLEISSKLIFLSNNRAKLQALRARGFTVERLKSIGAVNAAGAQEAEERGSEFGHLDINGHFVSFEADVERLKTEICESLGRQGEL